ncbi:hypothetical protein [Arthrospira platensis]|uniref:HNH endonuclease n=1 Tax=Limnospira platensis NIES-46 TaxID=1236695 RepID=A0A5M3T2K7_LIMPL|nr:hypothetical protein [Arthrospira platensis]AMW29425.1 hypothetical protein AP285_17235 [Arthrospira platensis YZ]KDR56791.1 hypothetical protein APPUASWS_015045 [Arthrospira platensis str. Paraca]MBD2670047.1 hypothetical protein [Arthrospira platensis FACHB-439]MBD2710733.1 hypothetical protein [Arthrospira platensis FACHB-835]MDF2213413.1 hypothetical protein [Arthrospira platensis NCB002]MDT9183326.1 hypothetical protein [Limnospira sp. PMC 289.06]MDT9295395.1 hypothetical protein [Ar
MPFDREIFYIEEIKLAESLELTQQGLDEIVDFLQASTDESIRLKEWLHFVVQNYVTKQQPIRIFSREGALAIASYLDLRGDATQISLKRVIALLDKYSVNQIDAKIRRALYENTSSLVSRNKRHWLNREDVVRIFITTSSRLEQAFRDIQRSDFPMRMNIDFEDYDGMRFFSLSGLEKLSIELSLKLRSEERRAYCKRVSEVAPPVLEFLAIAPSPEPKQIEQAMNFAKNRDQKTCQVTGVVRDKYNQRIELVGHHLYDKNAYHFLSADPDNILTIDKRLHEDFHQWNGGTQKTCTIDDFIDYVEWRYPDKHELILTLHNKQRVLMFKLAQVQRTLPESRD